VQFYTASIRKARRFSIASMNLTGHAPALFQFPCGAWAVQEESLSAAAGRAICRLLAGGTRCDRITARMVLAVLQESRDHRSRARVPRARGAVGKGTCRRPRTRQANEPWSQAEDV
jgi:hypothetical protein